MGLRVSEKKAAKFKSAGHYEMIDEVASKCPAVTRDFKLSGGGYRRRSTSDPEINPKEVLNAKRQKRQHEQEDCAEQLIDEKLEKAAAEKAFRENFHLITTAIQERTNILKKKAEEERQHQEDEFKVNSAKAILADETASAQLKEKASTFLEQYWERLF